MCYRKIPYSSSNNSNTVVAIHVVVAAVVKVSAVAQWYGIGLLS